MFNINFGFTKNINLNAGIGIGVFMPKFNCDSSISLLSDFLRLSKQ